MKLSEQLKQDNASGDYGRGLEGYHERAKALEDLLLMCVKDLYSKSCKFNRKTGLKLSAYVNYPNNEIDQNYL